MSSTADPATTAAPDAAGPDTDGPTYYLVDGSGFIFRAFHTIPMRVRKSDGMPTNAVYGFCAMLMKLLADIKADHVACIFDASGESFRNRIYDPYKANRDEPPEELRPQFPLIREASRAFGLATIEVDDYEADDIIATYCRLAREAGHRAVVVSSDKDLMQLVGDRVDMFDPMKNKPIGPEEVREKFGVGPERVIDVQALAGDSVDNVPGVPGIGIKTAAQLIEQFGDLDTLLARTAEIKQPKRRQNLIDHAEAARISRRLVTLVDDVPLPIGLDGLTVPENADGGLIAFLKEQEFPSLVNRAEGHLIRRMAEEGAAPAVEDEGEVEAAYELVTTEGQLDAWIARARERGVVAVDTETTGLNASLVDLVGISLATAPGQACYIPVGHKTGQGGLDLEGGQADGEVRQLPVDAVIAALMPLLTDPSVLKVGQNFKYDYQIFRRHGVAVGPADDTMLLSYVLDGGAHGHGMDELAARHLGYQTTKIASLIGTGKKQISFAEVPVDKALHYAAEDADITLRLHRVLKPRLVRERMATVYETIERPLTQVIGEMECAGIKVDRDVLAAMSRDFADRLVVLEGEVHGLAGHAFNLGSPKQLGTVLFDELGLPAPKRSKTGAYATGSEVLEPLAAQGHDIARKVLDWRQLAKLKSTYTDALQESITPRTGRVHTSFSLAATSTGRLSSNEPNLQNIPIRTEEGRKIRTAFVAEPGKVLISVDYSQIELRLVAEIAGVDALKQAFRDGLDIHAMTASQVFGIPLDRMDGETRRKAKAINFGIIYGISGFGLGNQLGIPQAEATAFIKQYLQRFEELDAWMRAIKKSAKEQGFVTTLFGRKVHLAGIKDPNPARRGFAERQAINAPIQGTAADIIKRAMVRIPKALARAGLADTRMLLQVHDELLFEAPAAQAEQAVAVVKAVMEGAASLSVPLVADAGIGANWAEAH